MRQGLSILALLLSFSAHGQISPPIAQAEDGAFYSACRSGQAGCAAGGSDPTAYTEVSIGSVTSCDWIELNVGNYEVVTVSDGDEDGICAIYQTVSTSRDIRVSAEIQANFSGTARQYAGVGMFIAESLDFTNDYFYTWWPIGDETMRCKHLDGGVRVIGYVGDDTAALAEYGVLQYVESSTAIQCGEGSDGTNWTQVGSDISHTLTFPVYVGFFATSASTSESNTFEVDNRVQNDALVTLDAGGDPTDPNSTPSGPSDTADYSDPVAGVSLLGGRTTVNVSNTAQLDAALPGSCGEDIVLAAGTYTGSKTVSTACPSNNPVAIIGADNFASVVTGTWTLTGDYNIVRGLKFDGTSARVTCQGTNNKILGNEFTGWNDNAVQTPKTGNVGTECEIAFNEFYSPNAYAGTAPPTEFRQGIKVRQAGSANTVHTNGWIHHNEFRDFLQKPDPGDFSSGDGDAIELGTYNTGFIPTFNSGWYVERNLMYRLLQSGNAAIDLKLGGVVARYNTVVDSDNVRIDIRYGSNSILEANYIENGGFTTHHDNGNVVCNAALAGQGIRAIAGALDCNEGTANGQPRTCNTLFDSNIASLDMGHAQGGGTILDALDNTIQNHTGSITLDNETGTTDNRNGAQTYTCPAAAAMNDGQAGPDAMPNATQAYKDARGL